MIRRKNLFSLSSLVRWWLTGATHGFFITFALVLAFEQQVGDAPSSCVGCRLHGDGVPCLILRRL